MQGDETGGGWFLGRGEREFEQVLRGAECGLEHQGESPEGDGALIVGNGEATLGDMKDPFGRAAVFGGIVKDSVFGAVGVDDGGTELVAIGGDGEGSGDAISVEHERVMGQAHRDPGIVEVFVEPVLNPPIHRGQVVGEESVGLALMGEEGMNHVIPFVGARGWNSAESRLPERGEAEVDVSEDTVVRPKRNGVTQSGTRFEVHGGLIFEAGGYAFRRETLEIVLNGASLGNKSMPL